MEGTGAGPPELDELFVATYQELRKLASSVKRTDKSVTLNPTALVHDAWLKLSSSNSLAFASEFHFRHIAARAMRQVLIETARKRNALKRSIGNVVFVTIKPGTEPAVTIGAELIALDVALQQLKVSLRQAALVENRFFGGLEIAEIAFPPGISEATAMRDWRSARAWLAQAVTRG